MRYRDHVYGLGCALLVIVSLAAASATAAEDPVLERLATCRDSWLDWKKANSPQLTSFAEHFQTAFTRDDNDPFFKPKSSLSIDGLRILQLYPDSVGMGVGFSVLVDATFDKTRGIFEKSLGKPLKRCETGDGMRTCDLELGEMRTFTLMAEDSPKSTSTLVGCYYYYEK
jgi:hypothetical protein